MESDNSTFSLGQPSASSTLGLRYPRQAPIPIDSMLLEPKQTQEWISGLPMANIGETARQVYKVITRFNRYQIPELARARTVELFREPVNYLNSNLGKHYYQVSFPLSPKTWKVANLNKELNNELAISYKIIIEEMLSEQNHHFDQKLLVIALHRALYYLGQVLLHSALVYSPWPNKIWKEIHTIYAYASQNRVHKTPVRAQANNKKNISTIEDLYKSFLIFASAGRFHFRQSNIQQLFEHSMQWGQEVELHKELTDTSHIGRFNIDLLADQAPIHNSLQAPVTSNRCLILDLQPLLKTLRNLYDDAPWENEANVKNPTAIFTRFFLHHLINTWSRPSERNFVRTKLNFELNIASGMSTIHHDILSHQSVYTNTDASDLLKQSNTLTNEPSLSGFSISVDSPITTEEIKAPSSLSLSPLETDLNSDSVFTKDKTDSFSIESSMLSDWDKYPEQTSSAPNKATIAIKTNNESAGGYSIRWPTNNTSKINVEELLGIESTANNHQYGLAIVRWIKHDAEQHLDLGLQVISSHIEAATLHPANQDGHTQAVSSDKVNCLILTPLEDNESTTSHRLIMSNFTFPIGSKLWLNIDKNQRLIQLKKVIEIKTSFVQIQFDYINEDNSVKTDNDFEESDFDDLWDTL